MLSDRSLYQRLAEFALDEPGAKFKFSDRLARDNGWTVAFAKQAIEEYKRFVYLAATSPTPVTPSDIVDQVWHLHLTYTRSYWGEMCIAILGKPLHHGPTKGGASEDARYRDLYAATLDAYRREFASEPPAAFWPPSEARFAGASHQRWVDVRTHAVVSWRSIARATAAAVGTMALTSAGVAFAADGKSEESVILGVVLLGGLIAAVILFAASGSHPVKRRRNGGDAGTYGIYGSGSSGKSREGGEQGGEHGGESGGESGGDGGSGCGGGGCSGS